MIKKLDINFIKSELKKIQNLFAAGNFEKVIEKTQILLKKDPTQTPFYNFIGLAYKQLNNLEMATSVFISGLKIRNDSPSILCNLGTVYRATEEFDKAEEVFSRALKLHPKNLSVLVNYANLKSDLNKIEVYEVSKWLNSSGKEGIIPQNSIDKSPSAELREDQYDPFDYNIVSPIVDYIINDMMDKESISKMGYDIKLVEEIQNKIYLSEYKRRQAPPGIKVSEKAFGIGRRFPIINKYREVE